jgi:hypothetical protein
MLRGRMVAYNYEHFLTAAVSATVALLLEQLPPTTAANGDPVTILWWTV